MGILATLGWIRGRCGQGWGPPTICGSMHNSSPFLYKQLVLELKRAKTSNVLDEQVGCIVYPKGQIYSTNDWAYK